MLKNHHHPKYPTLRAVSKEEDTKEQGEQQERRSVTKQFSYSRSLKRDSWCLTLFLVLLSHFKPVSSKDIEMRHY